MKIRPKIPEPLRRRILVESGHRCAIPTCRSSVTVIAHIVPYSEVKKHEYENLIALCPTCHIRADKGEIDRKSLRIYKRILQRITDRYERFELRVLDELRKGKPVEMAGNMILLIKNLLDNELIETNELQFMGFKVMGLPNQVKVILMQKGRKFINEWLKANE